MSSAGERPPARDLGGERSALETLLERHLPLLHGYVRTRLHGSARVRESSADVVQSVCRRVLAARESFEFRGDEGFRAWLLTTAMNRLRARGRYERQQRRDPAREVRALDHEPVTAAAFLLTPSQDAIGRETEAAIDASLAALSEDHREVLTLARLVGLPHRAIAEVMGRSEEATRQLLARATLALTDQLEQRGVDLERWSRR
jgi:RNA polymerase sigma-70 factor (ECF subfamily)